MERCLHHIAGVPASPVTGRFVPSFDPCTGRVVAELAEGCAKDVDRAVRAAEAANGVWAREHTPAQRGAVLHDLAAAIAARREHLAELESRDTGKPIGAARGDIDGVIATLRYNAGAADKLEGAVIPLGEAVVDFTRLEPLGVTAHIVPWNFPLGMALRSLAPALAAGCTAVLKPAEQTPLTATALAALAVEAGLPPGVLNVVHGRGPEAGAALTAHPGARGISFTGSVATGRVVGLAAAARFCPVVLELGGKNALVVWHDADLDRAVADALEGGFDNSGQVCSSASRVIVHEGVAEAFATRLAEAASRLRVGPGAENPELGPLISAGQRDKVAAYVEASGGRVLCGGMRPAHLPEGYFYAPTVLDRVPDGVILREEVFGPVVTVATVREEAEAWDLANAVEYGLAAGIHTADIGRAMRFARQLDAGSVWINGWFLGGVQAPTGGMKASGLGRERGLPGLRNYLRTKNVAIRL